MGDEMKISGDTIHPILLLLWGLSFFYNSSLFNSHCHFSLEVQKTYKSLDTAYLSQNRKATIKYDNKLIINNS